jgi:serine protein kinase
MADTATIFWPGRSQAVRLPRAYRFDGELNIANRGMCEFIEMLKADERFLYILLTLTQEKNIKTGRFSLIYADEFVIAHTNEAEFKEFLADKKSEALQDRMIMVQMPYNLKASAEVQIYEKLLKRASLGTLHIAQNSLDVAAMFAVLSALSGRPGMLSAPRKGGASIYADQMRAVRRPMSSA